MSTKYVARMQGSGCGGVSLNLHSHQNIDGCNTLSAAKAVITREKKQQAKRGTLEGKTFFIRKITSEVVHKESY